jgi:hypothetical protein
MGHWKLWWRGCARGELPGGRGGRLRPQAKAGRNDLIGDERRGRPGLAVRRPRPTRLTDAADGPPGRARFARAARGTRHLGMRAAWGRVHGLGKARLGKERRGPEAEVVGRGARARRSARAPRDVAFRLRLMRFTLV